MLMRILTSNWLAIPVLVGAALSLAFLYHTRGRGWEVTVGAILLVIAAILIFLGRDKKGTGDGSDIRR
jgi:uncharacterized membrane protein YfcA